MEKFQSFGPSVVQRSVRACVCICAMWCVCVCVCVCVYVCVCASVSMLLGVGVYLFMGCVCFVCARIHAYFIYVCLLMLRARSGACPCAFVVLLRCIGFRLKDVKLTSLCFSFSFPFTPFASGFVIRVYTRVGYGKCVENYLCMSKQHFSRDDGFQDLSLLVS